MTEASIAEKIGELAGRVVAMAAQQAAQHLENRRAIESIADGVDREFIAVRRDIQEFRKEFEVRLGHLERWRATMLTVWGAIMFVITLIASGAWEKILVLLRGK